MSVSHETSDQLIAYAGLLRKWNPRINLVSPATIDDLERRHISDCAQLASLVSPSSGLWVDLGSGGGLPGLIMAIYAQGTDARWTLVESDQRKGAFLRSVIRELGLKNTSVASARIESLTPLDADGITARALAPLPRLVPYLQRHLKVGGAAWVMKGRNWRAELAEAGQIASFTTEIFPSLTDPEAAILKLGDISA